MAITDFFMNWVQPVASTQTVEEEDIQESVDEPPDSRPVEATGFQKSVVRPKPITPTESLLTKALQCPEEDVGTGMRVATELSRRRSMISNASVASTAELTSDGGLTSPARTNTPSPPPPRTTYTSFAPYSLNTTKSQPPFMDIVAQDIFIKTASLETPSTTVSISPAPAPVIAPPKKRSISFACGGRKDPVVKHADPAPKPSPIPSTHSVVEAPKRACKIKFACGNNTKMILEKSQEIKAPKTEIAKFATTPKSPELVRRHNSRSPSMTRKSPHPSIPTCFQRASSIVRKVSRSPKAVRTKAKYNDLDERALQESEATRFHEFATEALQDDDWIRKEFDSRCEKLTISDTLKKENAIRRLGNEAEEEDQEDEDQNGSDDENDLEDAEDDEASDEDDASDGNETDNEAGFADSDDTDVEEEFVFWTPGRNFVSKGNGEATTYRASAHRAASTSSIDSLHHMSPPKSTSELRKTGRRPIKIRPGTPDLPDSTDFVCGTLDEDRPLENAYVSCMEARRFAKHKQTPQDIDPSFPTSEPEDENDNDAAHEQLNDSDVNVWHHGAFEDSDEGLKARHRSAAKRRKSPAPSPRRLHSPPPPGKRLQSPPPPARRLHSPPPPKTRLRSPPPKKLFGHSPRRMHSPPPAPSTRSPATSPTFHSSSVAIPFAPLGSRPGLTHTKSLPRTPNAFCRAYRATQLAAANDINSEVMEAGGPVRKAIDIVKGLERKRHYRKEKLYKGKAKNHDRRPLPGKGAERMREVGLHMAGKTGAQAPYMLSA